MPAKSKAHQVDAGTALSAKWGENKMTNLKGASKEMDKTMTENEPDDLASTSLTRPGFTGGWFVQ